MENVQVADSSVLEEVEEEKQSKFDMDVLLKEEWKEQIQEYESQIDETVHSKQLIQPKYYPFILGTLASMTGMLLGLDMSTISGANLFMPEDLHLNTKQFSLVSSGAALGAIPGAILLTPINEWIGRKYALVVCCLIFTIGAILEAAAHSYGIMIAGRILVGVVWKRIRSFENQESITEFFEMEKAVLEEKKLAEARPFYWLDIVQVPRSARAFIVANTLAGIVQLDGINSVVYYIGVLFKELGFSAEKSVYMSLVGGGSLMLGTIPAILLLDKWGRRMVGIVPSIVVFFGCIIIGCSFLSKTQNI
ncbi:Inositol transporter 1 [Galdieria sulphuraria]|nr:Inositol transporter 1 [Galdieria sulphuraria]